MKNSGSNNARKPVMNRIWKRFRNIAGKADQGGADRWIRESVSLIKESGLLDANWYVEKYPDVADAGIDPHLHYLLYGAAEGRDPGPKFNTVYYLGRYPDVAASKLNPLVHFIKHGRNEARSPVEEYIAHLTSSGVAPVETVSATSARPQKSEASSKKNSAENLDSFKKNIAENLKRVAPEGKSKTSENNKKANSTLKRFKGNVEIFDEKGITGWAVDTSKPGESVDVKVLVDGQDIFSVKTSRARADVSRAGMDGRKAGFFVPFPLRLLAPNQTLELRVGDVILKNGSIVAKNNQKSNNRLLSEYLPSLKRGELLPITVVVPVYNAWEATSRCLSSLARNLIPNAEVLVIDDASPDERISQLLERYRSVPGFRVHRNGENIGYTKNVNTAIAMCAGRDVVLLNSDTIVTKDWLRNLRYCAYSQSRVATVTALSDNSGAFSVPEMGKFNPCPSHLDAESVGQIVRQSGLGIGIRVPTGNGFCMYIRRAALNDVGAFDAEKFPRGYGEENEFCLRAMYAGWDNLVCDKAYVLHERSQSFQGEKSDLIAAGARQLRQEYPEYKTLITRFSDLEFSLMRARVKGRIESTGKADILPRVLYVISTQTGGTPQTNLDLMRAMRGRYDCWLLRSDGLRLTLYHLQNGELIEVEFKELSSGIEPYTHRSDEYDRVVLDMMYRKSIDLLHIRHIAWHGLGLAESAKALGIPVIFSVHDFYSVCSSVKLVDKDNRYCGVDLSGEKSNPLWPSYHIPEGFSVRWRKSMRGFLENCDQLITTTPSAVSLFSIAYPDQVEKFKVIPHGRDFAKFYQVSSVPEVGERIRVLIPGNISAEKGAYILERMAQLDVGKKYEFHFLGNTAPQLEGIGVHHGAYARDEFCEKVAVIKPHVGVVLSIWPETYCHTLTEMWACGIPVFGIDLGAVGDRIRATNCGWVIRPEASAEDISVLIQNRLRDRKDALEKLDAVRRWQETEGTTNTTINMASQYRSIYWSLLESGSSSVVT
ncbi:glycosyltransferase [Burkholderia multivorans]|uniref:glycosyltransferase n=1 Tax=Burkholderia multivorans TaxID=87883 RepID=UPI002B25404D|nr:glycosyltransferase [Burkholderia multivorans]MEB2486953.1 glycosyltransferase [Burkholderia multivorans]MEB2569507.1 glycosyltransferase [Burkholderia multivorans]